MDRPVKLEYRSIGLYRLARLKAARRMEKPFQALSFF
jgi:hypothetical protein